MSKLIICCGHGQGDTGAVNGQYKEADIVREIAKEMESICTRKDLLQILDMNKDHYRNKTFTTLNVEGNSQVLELHMDSSSNKEAKGSHVIITPMYGADKYDIALSENFGTILPGRARKIVPRNDIYNCNCCASRGIYYRLLELGFISNDSDLDYVLSHKTVIAELILDIFRIPHKRTYVDTDILDTGEKLCPKCKDILKKRLNDIWGTI